MKAYFFDIDGTLSNAEHRLHHIRKEPKDWDSFLSQSLDDKPIPHMVELANALYEADRLIVYITGRDSKYKYDTVKWLRANDLPVGPIYMRPSGDRRDDSVVKSEAMDYAIQQGWEPIMVFEDRSHVVKMWRERGIPAMQVVDGDY